MRYSEEMIQGIKRFTDFVLGEMLTDNIYTMLLADAKANIRVSPTGVMYKGDYVLNRKADASQFVNALRSAMEAAGIADQKDARAKLDLLSTKMDEAIQKSSPTLTGELIFAILEPLCSKKLAEMLTESRVPTTAILHADLFGPVVNMYREAALHASERVAEVLSKSN